MCARAMSPAPVTVTPGNKPRREKRPPTAREIERKLSRRPAQLVAAIIFALVVIGPAAWLKYVGDPFEKPGEAISTLDLHAVDGDTINRGGERIRLANVDAPEMPGRARCAEEATLAVSAQLKLADALKTGSVILLHRQTIIPRDVYGRTLARITVDGVDVADTLRKAGVARRYGIDFGWC